MSGVILRCPNCGTANLIGGECDACHEAEVRYFCTNHTPGLWLDSAACAGCGARFGDPAPSPKLSSAPVTRTAVPRVSEPRPAPRGRDTDISPWGTPDRDGAPLDDPGFGSSGRRARPDPARLVLEMISAAARARRSRADRYDYAEDAPPRRGGCLGRLVMLAVLLFGLFLLIPIFFGALFGFL